MRAREAGKRGRFSQGSAVPGYGGGDVPYSSYGPRRPRRLPPPPPRSAAARRRRARPGAPPPHRGPAPRGGRPAGEHVDRLLRADRAAARLAALGGDGGGARPGAPPHPRRARPPLPPGRLRAARAGGPLRPRHAGAAAHARPPRHPRPGHLGPGGDAGAERARGGAARRPDEVRGTRPQPLLPLVHRPRGARPLSGGRTREARPHLRRQPARRPRPRRERHRSARAGRAPPQPRAPSSPASGTTTRSPCAATPTRRSSTRRSA